MSGYLYADSKSNNAGLLGQSQCVSFSIDPTGIDFIIRKELNGNDMRLIKHSTNTVLFIFCLFRVP